MSKYKFHDHRSLKRSQARVRPYQSLTPMISHGLFWFVNTASSVLLLLIIIGLAIWTVMNHQAKQEDVAVQKAITIVREKVQFELTDVLVGCTQPNSNTVIVSVNHEIFLGVTAEKVYIPRLTDWYNEQAKKLAPELPIEDHDENLYYLMEYCR